MPPGNLFDDEATALPAERFDTLLAHRNLVIERIVSPDGTRTDEMVQPQDEWVVLLRGSATLEVNGIPRQLAAGDHLFLPAQTPHRVVSTSRSALWLAVHLHPGSGAT